ncbi:MAG TPA: hypothetical protein ENK18_24730 [Deltaproteobacteria bacterium]|nr:hypothetical protein [Deltaproteobacteria bacterium]
MILWTLIAAAWSAELRAVRAGDTVESIAESLGDVALASAIRGLNDLGADEQPLIGQLLTLPSPTVPQVEQQSFLVSVIGEVTVRYPTASSASPARAFSSLPTGSVVCTGEDSNASLRLASSCAGQGFESDDVALFEETCVEVRSVVASELGRSTVLRVLSGSISVADRASGGPARITVQAGPGVAMGQGGFRVHLEPSASLRAEALTRELAVLGAGAETVLSAGQGVRVRPDAPPGEIVDLLGAGPLLEPGPGVPLRRPVFRWEPDPEAFGYLFSIAGDQLHTKILYQEPLVEPAHIPKLLLLTTRDEGGLWWRVASFDHLGFLGLPTPARPFGLPLEE